MTVGNKKIVTRWFRRTIATGFRLDHPIFLLLPSGYVKIAMEKSPF